MNDGRLGRPIVRIREPGPVTLEEPIPQAVTRARPAALTRREIDRAQEAYDVDEGRTTSGVVEVVESPGVLGQRELLDVRIAVETDYRRVGYIGEHLAHTFGPRAVDEPEIRERVGSQASEQLG